VLESADGSSPERMSADEGEPFRQAARRSDDVALRAAGVGDDGRLREVLGQLHQQVEILLHRRGEDDQVGLGEYTEIRSGNIDRVQPHCRLQHVGVVHADDQRRRPQFACGQRNGPSDQPQADDANLAEQHGRWLGAAQWNDGGGHRRQSLIANC
jgi:hypothetical protein